MTKDIVEKLVISSEKDAFDLLAKSLKDQIPENAQIVFDGWPIFKLSIYGEDFDGTIPTRIMPPILDLQREIHRIYCREKYGSESLSHLKDYERDFLELVVEIKPGCSQFISKLFDTLNKVIQDTDMTGKEAIILMTSIAAILTGGVGWYVWVQSNERMHGQDLTVQLSQEETKRQAMLIDAISQNSNIKKASEGVNAFRASLSKKLKDTDTIKINDQPVINGARAAEIVPAPKVEAEAIRLDGDFTISEIKFPKADEFGKPYRLTVERISDKLKLTVDASHDKLSPDQVKVIQEGGFQLKVVTLQINAKKLRGNITRPELYSIEWPESK